MANLPLSKDERLKFVNAVLEAQRKNPDWGWKPLFEQARKALPRNRMSKNMDHPNKLPWIKPMLGIEDKPKIKTKVVSQPVVKQKEVKQHTTPTKLDEAEKLAFAKGFLEFKKSNPEAGSSHAIRHANTLLPEDRKIGAKIDSVRQIKWIIPLLEQLENAPAPKGKWECRLTDKEKEEFAAIVYRLRKGGSSWTRAMREANAFMPKEHRIADSIINPSSVPWLSRALAKLEEADKSRVVIDHRGTLPKAEEAPEPHGRKQHKQIGPKLRLTDEDKMYFAEIVYQLRKVNPGWGWQKILNEANSEMPAHKQRAGMPPAPSNIPWLPALLDEVGKRPPERYIPEPVKAEVAPPAPAPVAPVMDMQAMMMAAMEKVIRENMAAGGGMTMPTMPAMPQPAKPEPIPRKKVIVVGLLPVQTNEIQKRFGHKFDFKFIGSNTPNQQIRESIKHGDIGILMTRFVSHPTQAAMRDHPGFTFCNGNSTALENLLEEKIVKMDGQ